MKHPFLTKVMPLLFPAVITALVFLLAALDPDSELAPRRVAVALTAGLGALAWVLAVRYYPAPGLRGAGTRVLLGLEVLVIGFGLLLFVPTLPRGISAPLSVLLIFLGNLGLSRLFWSNPLFSSFAQLLELVLAPWRRLRRLVAKR